MENNIKQDWNRLTNDLNAEASDAERFVYSKSNTGWIKSNLIELLINIGMAILMGLFLFLFDDRGTLPIWSKVLLGLCMLIPLWPIIILYKQINYPDRTQSSITFLRKLIQKINWYRNFQIIYNSAIAIGVTFVIAIHFKAITATVDGVLYEGIITFPEEIRLRFMKYAAWVSLGIALLSAPMPLAMYLVFYHEMRQNAKKKLKELEEA